MSADIRAVHRCAGLAAGVAICILGLSGSLLVFRPELERLIRPELFHVKAGGTPASIAEMQTIAAAAPGLELYRVRLPHNDSTSHEFFFGTGGKLTTRIYVDAYTRRVLGTRTAQSDFFLWLQALHFDLLAAGTGRRINGAIAATLLVLSLSGLTLWLRSRASWSARLRPRWRVRPARRVWGMHVTAGIWTAPFLLLMSATALYFAFHDPVAKIVYVLTRTPQPPAPPNVATRPPAVPLDALLREARSLEPAAELTLLRLPRAPGQPATVNYVLAGDLSDLGANAIHFDPNTGIALRIDRVRDMHLGQRVLAAFVPLHFGTFGGTPTRVLWASFGVLPSVLFATGLAICRRRARRLCTLEAPSSDPQDRAHSLVEVSES